MNFFASVTCPNFYISCEKIVTPSLAKRPVIVLNEAKDWIFSCSEEAKAYGIMEKRPYALYHSLISEHSHTKQIIANMSLYENMSQRIETCLRYFIKSIERVALGEVFIRCECESEMVLMSFLRYVCQIIKKWTGISLRIGVGFTKTLAKCANYSAGTGKKAIYSLCDEAKQNEILKNINVYHLPGISYEEGHILQKMKVRDALMLKNTSSNHVTDCVKNIQEELKGTETLAFEELLVEEEMKHSLVIYSIKRYS